MKKMLAWLLAICCIQAKAQEYKITANRNDPFSVALVKLLQCGINRFEDCRGEFLQYTMMQESEYRLTIPFPNSIAGIVRVRDWNKNAYVEFGPYADRIKMGEAVKQLKQQIQQALGRQLYKDRYADSLGFYSMSIADEKGFFQSSFELLTGTTAEKSYLLAPSVNSTVKSDAPKHNFILLKVQAGIPMYYHFIPGGMRPADDSLHLTLQQLAKAAATDFSTLIPKDSLSKKKRTVTVQMNGHTVYIDRRGGSRNALIKAAAAADTSAFEKQWGHYLHAMAAAAGDQYVYHRYELSGRRFISFFSRYYDPALPRLYLEAGIRPEEERYITLRVESLISHPVKRSASFGDEED